MEAMDDINEQPEIHQLDTHQKNPKMFSENNTHSIVNWPPNAIITHGGQSTQMNNTPSDTLGRRDHVSPQMVSMPPGNLSSQPVNDTQPGGHVSSLTESTTPETISSDLEPPDSSDIAAATLEERPSDDSNMTLDLLEDSTIAPQNQVVEKMEESPNVQVENNMIDIKPNLDMVAVYLQNCSEYFKKNPHQLKSCSRAQVDRFDTEDPTFPSGWKVKITFCLSALLS